MQSTSIRGIPLERISDTITSFIKDHVNFKTAIVGLSGGVDSSTVLALLVKALGNKNVFGLIMPDSTTTPSQDIRDAVDLASSLGVRWRMIYIDGMFRAFMEGLSTYDRVAAGNLRARIRMALLYYHANTMNGIVIGTGDKSEILLGYFTKYGDGGVDILPIGDVYKTEVRELATYLGVPHTIVAKKSSPRLWAGQEAESELGFTYEVADIVLYRVVEKGEDPDVLRSQYGNVVDLILKRVEENRHKRELPPTALVS